MVLPWPRTGTAALRRPERRAGAVGAGAGSAVGHPGVLPAPSVVVFDVNETLSDLTPLGERFAAAGADPGLARLWFASVLRDGFALTLTGSSPRFAEVGAANLASLFPGRPEVAAGILAAFSDLPLHPDVVPGVTALRSAGWRLATLSNGSVGVAESLLGTAGIRAELEAVLSVDDVGRWKPAAAAYRYAARRTGVSPDRMVLVACHPWDLHGAAAAGLRTAWLERSGRAWPEVFEPPTWRASSLPELAEILGAPG